MIQAFRPLAVLLLVVTVQMSIAEFLAVREFGDRRRRARFALPATCKPAITAKGVGRGRVQVVVTCLDRGGVPTPRRSSR